MPMFTTSVIAASLAHPLRIGQHGIQHGVHLVQLILHCRRQLAWLALPGGCAQQPVHDRPLFGAVDALAAEHRHRDAASTPH